MSQWESMGVNGSQGDSKRIQGELRGDKGR